ncbi:hypothetical protein Dimus_029587 [Dionaea muscipula]
MAKTKKTSQPAKEKSLKKPLEKVFQDINVVRSSMDQKLFESIAKLFSMGKSFSYSLPLEADSAVNITTKGAIAVYYDHLLHGLRFPLHPFLIKPKGADGAGSSRTQTKKKIPREKKEKKATSEVTTVEEENVPFEGTVDGEAKNATQESQAVKPKKTKPPTKPRNKNTPSPTVGENEVETEEENDSERTESDNAMEENAQREEAVVVPIVEEEGQQKKRRLKKATSTGPQAKRPKVARHPWAKIQREEYILSLSRVN